MAAEDDPGNALTAAKGVTWPLGALGEGVSAPVLKVCVTELKQAPGWWPNPVFKYFQPVTAEAMEGEEQELVGPRLVLTSGLGCSGV